MFNIDLKEIKKNINNFSNDKLCEMIVSTKYLSLNKEIITLCMEELAERRQQGDPYLFENKIEQLQKDLPVLNFSTANGINLNNVLSVLGKIK